MIDTDINKQPLNRVTAIFADSSLSFLLPQGAMLENIADCLDDFSVRRERGFIAVVIKFAATALQVPRQNWLPFRTGLLAELPRPRAFARSMACNPDRADDLVQETLAKAWAHQSKFKDATNLRAWLSTILRNTYCTPFSRDPV